MTLSDCKHAIKKTAKKFIPISFIELFCKNIAIGECIEPFKFPPIFATLNYPSEAPPFINLKNTNGFVWRIETKRDAIDKLYLTTGWPNFVVDNKIDCYDTLVFTQYFDVIYVVDIFGSNSCLRDDVYEGKVGECRHRFRFGIKEHPCVGRANKRRKRSVE